MSQQKGMSFKELRQRFPTEAVCEVYLFEQRCPDRIVCLKCGRHGCCRLHGRHEHVCKQCHRQSSVTAGTVLHHTHLPLTVWFWAIYLVTRDKRGVSIVQFSRELEISYSSAWYLLHHLHKAMGERDKDYILSDAIELDDAYFGAPKSNGKRGREIDKTNALTAVLLTEQGCPVFSKYVFPNWMQSPYVPSPSKSFVPEARPTVMLLSLFALHSNEPIPITIRLLIKTAELCAGNMP